jgi:hypothetical protein
MKGLKERFPEVELVPFARRADNADESGALLKIGGELWS